MVLVAIDHIENNPVQELTASSRISSSSLSSSALLSHADLLNDITARARARARAYRIGLMEAKLQVHLLTPLQPVHQTWQQTPQCSQR